MHLLRRTFLNNFGTAGALSFAVTVGLLKPGKVLAAEWNKTAFDSTNIAEALKNTGGIDATESKDILLKAPESPVYGLAVQLEVTSKIPGTTSIAVFVERGLSPLVADCVLSEGAEPYMLIRTKMEETSRIRAQVKAGGKTYFATKNVIILPPVSCC